MNSILVILVFCALSAYCKPTDISYKKVIFIGDEKMNHWSVEGKESWRKYFVPLESLNLGFDGATVKEIHNKTLNDGMVDGAVHAKVVVLMVGGNDMAKSDGKSIMLNMNQLNYVLRVRIPGVKVLLLGVLPSRDKHDVKTEILNGELRKLDTGNNVRFLDFSKKFQSNRDLYKDSNTLSAEGYKVWAETMTPLLKEMLNK